MAGYQWWTNPRVYEPIDEEEDWWTEPPVPAADYLKLLGWWMQTTMDLLAEIRAAFPAIPYPGDATLSDCWCEECAWSLRNLRGKSWMQLRIEDGIGGEGAILSV